METSRDKKNERLTGWAVFVLRLAVGCVFVVSGFTKGIDIWGLEYKISDYLAAFGWTSWASPYVGFVSVMLPWFEFVAGLLLAIGSFRRLSVWLLLASMVFMLPLSAYIAVVSPVSDCGCFGEAFQISNTATFIKNIIITACLCILLKYNTCLRSMYGPAVQWLTVVIPSVYILIIMAIGFYIQPLLDFRPFKVGTYVYDRSAGESDEQSFVFIYEKNGVAKEFQIDSLPDDSWTFVDRREVVAKAVPSVGQSKLVNQIAIFDGNDEVTEYILSQNEDLILLLISDAQRVDVASTFKINEMVGVAAEKGVAVVCLTSGSEKDMAEWKDVAMADYPIYKMDDSELKMLARGNPALVQVRDGQVMWKATLQSVDLEEFVANLNRNAEEEQVDDPGIEILAMLTFFMAVLMILLLLVNRSVVIIKFGRRLKKNQNKAVNLQEKSGDSQNN